MCVMAGQVDVVEVVARASWEAWRACSLGAPLDDSELPGLFSPRALALGLSSERRLAVQLLGPQLSATGFFDPRGVGIPAEISKGQAHHPPHTHSLTHWAATPDLLAD